MSNDQTNYHHVGSASAVPTIDDNNNNNNNNDNNDNNNNSNNNEVNTIEKEKENGNTSTENIKTNNGESDKLKQVELHIHDTSSKGSDNNHTSSGDITREPAHSIQHSASLRLDTRYRIDEQKYKLWRGFVRQDWQILINHGELEELRADWIELFFDLMFVAVIVHISAQASYAWDKYSRNYLLTVCAQFAMIISIWLEQVMYESRFSMTQVVDEIIRWLVMGAILILGLSVGDEEIFHKAFLFFFAICKLFLGLGYLKVYLIPRAKKHAIYMITEKVIIIIISITLMFTVRVYTRYEYHKKGLFAPDWSDKTYRRLAGGDTKIFKGEAKDYHDDLSLTYFAIYISLFLLSHLWTVEGAFLHCMGEISIPVNIPHIAERFGLFALITVGESIISLMTATLSIDSFGSMLADYGVVFFSFILVYSIARLYFTGQPAEESIHHGKHALRVNIYTSKAFVWSHGVLYLAYLCVGIGAKITANHLRDTERGPIYVMLPGYALTVILSMYFIHRAIHPRENEIPVPKYVWILRILSIVIMIGIGFLWQVVYNFLLLLIYTLIVLFQYFIDFEGKEQIKHRKSLVKEAATAAHSKSTIHLHIEHADDIDDNIDNNDDNEVDKTNNLDTPKPKKKGRRKRTLTAGHL